MRASLLSIAVFALFLGLCRGLTITTPVADADLISSIIGSPSISISAVSSTGTAIQRGKFTALASDGLGLSSGIVLSSGSVAAIPGVNAQAANGNDLSTSLSAPGDADLSLLTGGVTQDAATLQFTVGVGSGITSLLKIDFVFGSEEYVEFVGSSFNDPFAIFVDGKNCAQLPDGKFVSVNNVNNAVNPALFVLNPPGTFPIKLDGWTKVITCTAQVFESALIKVAIADAADTILDSAVFIRGSSVIISVPVADIPPPVTLACNATTENILFGSPIESGSCVGGQITFVDTLLSVCQGTKVISRSFQCGNAQLNGTQIITVGGPQFTFFPDDVVANCPFNTLPSNTGEPTAISLCSTIAGISYTDSGSANCPAGGTIIRTWTVTDECGTSVSKTQNITTLPSPFTPCPITKVAVPLELKDFPTLVTADLDDTTTFLTLVVQSDSVINRFGDQSDIYFDGSTDPLCKAFVYSGADCKDTYTFQQLWGDVVQLCNIQLWDGPEYVDLVGVLNITYYENVTVYRPSGVAVNQIRPVSSQEEIRVRVNKFTKAQVVITSFSEAFTVALVSAGDFPRQGVKTFDLRTNIQSPFYVTLVPPVTNTQPAVQVVSSTETSNGAATCPSASGSFCDQFWRIAFNLDISGGAVQEYFNVTFRMDCVAGIECPFDGPDDPRRLVSFTVFLDLPDFRYKLLKNITLPSTLTTFNTVWVPKGAFFENDIVAVKGVVTPSPISPSITAIDLISFSFNTVPPAGADVVLFGGVVDGTAISLNRGLGVNGKFCGDPNAAPCLDPKEYGWQFKLVDSIFEVPADLSKSFILKATFQITFSNSKREEYVSVNEVTTRFQIEPTTVEASSATFLTPVKFFLLALLFVFLF